MKALDRFKLWLLGDLREVKAHREDQRVSVDSAVSTARLERLNLLLEIRSRKR
jgi:hypothetical protein